MRTGGWTIYNSGMTRIEAGLSLAAVLLTIVGAAFWIGSNMATREAMDGNMREIRATMDGNMREIRATMDGNMREIRAYIVDHMDGHPPGAD